MSAPTVYHLGTEVLPETIEQLAAEYKLPEPLTAEVTALYKAHGFVESSVYPEEFRAGIDDLMENLSTTSPDEASRDEIIDGAAFSLMGAMTKDDNFLITEEGICTINPANPPDLIHAYQVVTNVLKLRELGDVVEDKSTWMLGSIVSNLRKHFGEAFDPSQVCEMTGVSYNTLYTAENVYNAFEGKRYRLPFTTHKEAFYAKISDDPEKNAEARNLILQKAERYDLNSKHVRSLCSVAKKMEDDQVIRNIRSHKAAEDLIAAYKDAKVKYIVLDDNVWSMINGTAAEIPTGRLVIDLKNNTVRRDNGEPLPIVTVRKKKRKD